MLPANLSPIGDRLLVEVAEQKETTIGGIVIPVTVGAGNDLTGTVLATGSGEKNKEGILLEMTVHAGNKVLFPKSSAQEVTINGKKYFIVKERDVYGIVE